MKSINTRFAVIAYVVIACVILGIAPNVTAQTRTQNRTIASCCDAGTSAKTLKTAKATKTPLYKASAQFASLANDASFRTAHLEPLSFVLEGGKGSTVKVKAADGTDCLGYEIKAAKPSKSVVFVLHEWWGLNDYVKRDAEQLAAELGVTVIALDLYDGKVATTREEASTTMRAMKRARAIAIIQAFGKYVGTDVKIGTVGWCFGGTWSMQSSITLGKQASACVMYYGMPEMDEKAIADFNPPTLGIFAKEDKFITPEIVGKFEKAMKTAGKAIDVKFYNADHAFANPSNPKFNKAFTEEAHTLTVDFLKKHLL